MKKSRENDRPRQFYDFSTFPCVDARIAVWGTNSALGKRPVVLELAFYDLASSWVHANEPKHVVLEANAATEILEIPIPEPPLDPQKLREMADPDTDDEEIKFSKEMASWDPPRTLTHRVVVAARLVDVQTREVIARAVDWPQPFTLIKYRNPELSTSVISVDEEHAKVRVSARRPARGVVLFVEGDPEVHWSDNMLDIMPGDPQEVEVTGLAGRKVLA